MTKNSMIGEDISFFGKTGNVFLGIVLQLLLVLCFSPLMAINFDEDRMGELKMAIAEAGYALPTKDVLKRVLEIDSISIRKLTPEGLVEAAKFVLERDGEKLQKNSVGCFTCSMRVLTPEGYVEIQKLNVGDKVLSWDTDKNKYIENEITQIHHLRNQIVGQLNAIEAIKTIEVTPQHRFYRPDLKSYEPISNIPPGSPLLSLNLNLSCKSFFKPNNSYKKLNSLRDVFNLSLKKKPHNFIVEGILVHNVKFGA